MVSDRAAQRENGQSEILASSVATNRELTKFADTEEGGGKRQTIYHKIYQTIYYKIYHKYIKHQIGQGNSCNVDSIYYRESRGGQMARRAPNPENSKNYFAARFSNPLFDDFQVSAGESD